MWDRFRNWFLYNDVPGAAGGVGDAAASRLRSCSMGRIPSAGHLAPHRVQRCMPCLRRAQRSGVLACSGDVGRSTPVIGVWFHKKDPLIARDGDFLSDGSGEGPGGKNCGRPRNAMNADRNSHSLELLLTMN